MKVKYILPRLALVFLTILAVASCEEDFSNIDTDIIDQNFNTLFDDTKTVVAYSQKLQSVQSNNLPAYQLGVYNDPVYGQTTANLLTQLVFSDGDSDPNFGDCTVLDSVVLYIPYFSEGVTENEVTTYTLDSVFGNSPININIFESNFFLNALDPNSNFEDPQNYYSDQGPLFRQNIVAEGANSLNVQISDLTPSAEAITELVVETNEAGEEIETLRELPPGLRILLPNSFFEEKIIQNEGTTQLLNNNNFREFFRGLYFEVEPTAEGNLFLFDLSAGDSNPLNNARITMYYTFNDLTGNEMCGDEGLDEFQGDVQFQFNAIAVNTFENELPGTIETALQNANVDEGESRLYVRGGEGIVTVIELFGEDLDGNGVADELDDLREQKWLINEANLIFYVDQDVVNGGSSEPERLIIYDLENNRRLADFNTDLTSNLVPVDAFSTHLGRLDRGSDENGDFYKIRITSHLSDLINRDSTNVALGLIVNQNVTVAGFQDLRDSIMPKDNVVISQLPNTSVIAPQGTVLIGNTSTNLEKRLKLQIFYTEPQ